MKKNELIKAIEKLPASDRLYVIERSMHILRMQGEVDQLEEAAKLLQKDYENDKDLTVFTDLDMESFYEAR
jgi:hypothetical protein